MICPSCGIAGNEKIFYRIGGKKLLCSQCRAVLTVAFKCPVCDGIISLPFIMHSMARWIYSLSHHFPWIGFNNCRIRCPICDFEDVAIKFEKVLVYGKEFTLMMK